MDLPEPHYSPNRWIAQVMKDNYLIDPMFHNKGKFIALCWNPKGEICGQCKVFNTPEEAQAWIESLDSQTKEIDTPEGKATVFINGDGNYWWKSELNTYHRIYQASSMDHAIRLTKSSLKSLADTNCIF